MTGRDIELTRRSLELAAKGLGKVSPNPLVGCVVTDSSGEVVGEGTYLYEGITHAEMIALENAGERARGGTAYVSLEPHHHHGRTPPCTEELINAGIARVVCPIEDPNPLVSGRGFERLRAAGVEVVAGPLAAEAARLNEAFICWHRRGRPFVHLKLAASLDGRISMNRNSRTPLSGETALRRTHQLRHEHDAILIGANTAAVDDPILTDRSGQQRRRPLVRIVLDNRLRLDPSSRLAATAEESPVLVFTTSRDNDRIDALTTTGIEVVVLADGGGLNSVLGELRTREIQSVLVEGGSEVAGAFCDARLVDKVTFIVAPRIIGGVDAPAAVGGQGPASIDDAIRVTDMTATRLGDDIELTGYPTFGEIDP